MPGNRYRLRGKLNLNNRRLQAWHDIRLFRSACPRGRKLEINADGTVIVTSRLANRHDRNAVRLWSLCFDQSRISGSFEHFESAVKFQSAGVTLHCSRVLENLCFECTHIACEPRPISRLLSRRLGIFGRRETRRGIPPGSQSSAHRRWPKFVNVPLWAFVGGLPSVCLT